MKIKSKKIEKIQVKCEICNKIVYLDKNRYEDYKNDNNIINHRWHYINNSWSCHKCYCEARPYNIYGRVKPESEAFKGTIIKCKLCDNTDRLYYHRHDIHIPNVRELTDKGWHKFGPRWLCSKCYDKEVRVVPRSDKDYPLED